MIQSLNWARDAPVLKVLGEAVNELSTLAFSVP
jgi:hypothetical protein